MAVPQKLKSPVSNRTVEYVTEYPVRTATDNDVASVGYPYAIVAIGARGSRPLVPEGDQTFRNSPQNGQMA
jgi:hypothetical protein